VSVYQAVARLEEQNEAGALCTVVRTRGSTPRAAASKMLVYPDGRLLGTIGGGEMESRVIEVALQVIRDGKPRLVEYSLTDTERGDPGVCGGQMEVYVEPVLPEPVVIVVGCGHVGKAVAHLAKWLNFRVLVSDDRAELCTPDTVPGADGYFPIPMRELPEQVKITPWTYVVLTTRGVDIDVPGLPALLDSPAAYIGVIGSRRRWETTHNTLLEKGIAPEKLGKVHSPMGVDLGAETPEEIALSILAEIIMLREGRPAGVKKLSDKN
jgi:xanthine dehydrogenase accessory factor